MSESCTHQTASIHHVTLRNSNFFTKLSFITIALIINSCGASHDVYEFQGEAFRLTGSMEYIDIEGGCWQFVGEDGNNYELVGPRVSSLFQDGVKAELVVRSLRNISSICMVGDPVLLLEIIEILN